jgi:hypothetical protein
MKINMPAPASGRQVSELRAINGGRGTCLNPNETCRQLLAEGQDLATLQLATDDCLAGSINAVGLRHSNNDSPLLRFVFDTPVQ